MSLRRPWLGELEVVVLETLWAAGSSDAKQVLSAIGRERKTSLSTVQSTLERLCRKNLLKRKKVSHAFIYSPIVTRDGLMTHLIDDVVRSVSDGGADSMLAAIVAIAERADEKNLRRLEKLIAERRVRSAAADGDKT